MGERADDASEGEDGNNAGERTRAESEHERFLRLLREAREFLARVEPSLACGGMRETVLNLTLASTLSVTLQDAYRHDLGASWLEGLGGRSGFG